MKKMFVLAIFLFLTNGCATYYGNQKDYDAGNWWGLGNSSEVARIQQDKLALKKLEKGPSFSDPDEGYLGVVKNFNSEIRNFKISGPETKSFCLGPEGQQECYLIPGEYKLLIFDGGNIVGNATFEVGPQINYFLGKEYHWYVSAQKNQ